MFVFAAQAQKSCTAKKTAGTSCCMATAKAAATAASLDNDIESRTCAKSGKVSYVKKVVNAETGAVNFEEVKWCTTSKKFINASPSKKACTKGAKACTKAKATSTSAKSCTKPCTKSTKTVKLDPKPANVAKAKLVKGETN